MFEQKFGALLKHSLPGDGSVAPRVPRMIVIVRLRGFAARQADFIRVDDDHVIPRIHVGREGRPVLARQDARNARRQTTDGPVRGIHDIPLSIAWAWEVKAAASLSITIDEALLEAANLIVGEKVSIVNVNNGERFETYIIRGERNSGTITLNGPAARKVQKGDIVIIISYALMDFEEAKTFQPTVIFPWWANKPINDWYQQ